jgi:putative FmdB family regulatory protein
MPIYGYVCKNCEHRLDALQKISDDPLVDCPECGEPQLRRQLSAPKQRNLHGEKEPAKKDEKPAAGKADKGDAKPAAGNKSGVG